jgi:hypothetical protein
MTTTKTTRNTTALTQNERKLRKRIVSILKKQGFKVNPHIIPAKHDKDAYRNIQQLSKLEQLRKHKNFLLKKIDIVKSLCLDGKSIDPTKISLELKEVRPNTIEETIYRWWNLAWWSIPYQHSYGRQMRFLLWDKGNENPFGLIGLQSPILKMAVRDKYLGIPKDKLDIWINKSMSAQRVGALPPYNDLLGGKMTALSLISNEVRTTYREKYNKRKTLIKNRIIEPDLLFITTTSAFGKSSIYNRLKYKNKTIAFNLGLTKGTGTFHIPQDIYNDILIFLESKKIPATRSFGYGPSRKIKLFTMAFSLLGLPRFEIHGIKREVYLFPLVSNLKNVIKHKDTPKYFNLPFSQLADFWKERWAIPRANRISKWKNFDANKYFSKVKQNLIALK